VPREMVTRVLSDSVPFNISATMRGAGIPAQDVKVKRIAVLTSLPREAASAVTDACDTARCSPAHAGVARGYEDAAQRGVRGNLRCGACP
jgi:hypothetical protein